METLIQQLRREHGAIMYQLGQVHQQGLQTPAGRKLFTQTMSSLNQHLLREDGEFYPSLLKLAKKESTLQELLQQNGASSAVQNLRQLFESMQLQLQNVQTPDENETVTSFKQLQELFLQRISWEENTLFPNFLTVWRRTRQRV